SESVFPGGKPRISRLHRRHRSPLRRPGIRSEPGVGHSALSEPRFGEARTDFEAAHRNLRDGNTKEALWMMFRAVEVAAKVLFPGKFATLAASEVDRHIRPTLDRRYAGNQPAIDAGRL